MVALSAGAEDAASTSADDLQLAEQRYDLGGYRGYGGHRGNGGKTWFEQTLYS